mmetsp:Transcript_2005/g.2967  ORF Transcript_2005/g.2967 Transcript_2005/m.2967 type:complete len:80 (-) Transcript_2005:140-379(-)
MMWILFFLFIFKIISSDEGAAAPAPLATGRPRPALVSELDPAEDDLGAVSLAGDEQGHVPLALQPFWPCCRRRRQRIPA